MDTVIPQYQTSTMPSMHYSDRGGVAVRYIVVHSTETPSNGTVQGTIDYLRRNDRGASCHELVVPGRAIVMVPDGFAAHHAGSDSSRFPNGAGGFQGNAQSWGIELYRKVNEPISQEIVAIGIDRVAQACKRFGLGVDAILAHRDVDPERRQDPSGVDIDWFRAQVAKRLVALGATVPAGKPLPEDEQPADAWQALDKATWWEEELERIRARQDWKRYDAVRKSLVKFLQRERQRFAAA